MGSLLLALKLRNRQLATVQPARNLHKPSDPGDKNYPRAVEHRDLTSVDLVDMTLAYRDDRTRGFAMVAREGSSRSTFFSSSTLYM